jgi:hypothetical protein
VTVDLSTQRRERDIQRAILDLLHARGVLAWKAGSGAFRVPKAGGGERYVKMGHEGVADILGALPGTGKFLAIEVKRPGQSPTQAQAAFLTAVQMAGGVAFVASSCADVVAALWGGPIPPGVTPRNP